MLSQSYTFQLKYEIVEGLVTSGRLLDIKASVLICVTSIGKVILYSPQNANPSFLNINREIKALQCNGNILIMASENILIAHDVQNNFDLYFKEIMDGISVIQSGVHGKKGKSLTFIGGNCNIQGFDVDGEEEYWNVASDDVSCLDIFENSYIIIGSNDNTLRVYEYEEILYQISLPSVCISVNGIILNNLVHCAYGLQNGQVGLYRQQIEIWSDKADKNQIFKIIRYEQDYLVVARQNGSIELRNIYKGTILQKIQEDQISGLLIDDIRGIGSKQIIIVTKSGTVKGFVVNKEEEQNKNIQDQIEQLQKQKSELSQQIFAYQQQSQLHIVPPQTQITIGLRLKAQNKFLEIKLELSEPNTFICQVILFSDALFKEGQTHNIIPSQTVYIPLQIKENIQFQLTARVYATQNQYSNVYQVYEVTTNVPKFAKFIYSPNEFNIQSYVEAKINDRIPRYIKWIDQCFIIDDKHNYLQKYENSLEFKFNCQNIMNGVQLQLYFNQPQGLCQIRCDDIQTCADVIQDLSNFLQLTDLQTRCSFPNEMQNFKDILKIVEQQSQNKVQINAEVAESINVVKSLIVKAEDSRLINDIGNMKKLYSNIMVQNKAIQSELIKKNQNTDILITNLKSVNSMISKGSELRVGQSKTQITNLCRNAIKKKNFVSLIDIIQEGHEI
ncbi:hypothetical protein pb186bvf_016122 [Paramecium bursaria]